jgi:hypothetical protein
VSDDLEIVPAPAVKRGGSRARVAFNAALKISARGQGVRLRFQSDRERDSAVTYFMKLTRGAGRVGHTCLGTNLTATFWIDP